MAWAQDRFAGDRVNAVGETVHGGVAAQLLGAVVPLRIGESEQVYPRMDMIEGSPDLSGVIGGCPVVFGWVSGTPG